MLRWFSVSTVAAAMSFAALSVSSTALADQKIAVVNMQKAINESIEGEAANTSLKALQKKRQEEVSLKETALVKEKAELDKRCATPNRDACDRGKEDLQRKFYEMQNLKLKYEEELQKKQFDATQGLIAKVLVIVRRIAQSDGFDLVVDTGAIHFNRGDMDITDRVIKTFNAESPAPSKTPGAAPGLKPGAVAPTPVAPVNPVAPKK